MALLLAHIVSPELPGPPAGLPKAPMGVEKPPPGLGDAIGLFGWRTGRGGVKTFSAAAGGGCSSVMVVALYFIFGCDRASLRGCTQSFEPERLCEQVLYGPILPLMLVTLSIALAFITTATTVTK